MKRKAFIRIEKATATHDRITWNREYSDHFTQLVAKDIVADRTGQIVADYLDSGITDINVSDYLESL